MGFWNDLRSMMAAPVPAQPAPRSEITGYSLTDPRLAELLRGGGGEIDALRNAAVNRCVTIISNAIGMLPTRLMERDPNGQLTKVRSDHGIDRMFRHRSNHWQTPFVFKRTMQMRALLRGNAYALPIFSGQRLSELIPLNNVRTEQSDDWTVEHIVTLKRGGEKRYKARELVHLMGPSLDGIKGLSMMDYAREVLSLSRDSDKAMQATMRQGLRPGGALEMPETRTLSDEAHARLKADMQDQYSGAENNGRWMVLEEGMKAKQFLMNAKESQGVELRTQQVEEVARIFGVPRPFLMLDDTSWGSGIEQLGIFFVQYALAPWFTMWEQAFQMALLKDDELDRYAVKFNEKALLRGSMKDQAEVISKLLGAGGSPQVYEVNEARDILELPEHPDGFGLFRPGEKTNAS